MRPPHEPDPRPAARLLLVGDEPTNLQVLRHILLADYRLLFATDGIAHCRWRARQQARPGAARRDDARPGRLCRVPRSKADPPRPPFR